ncbi:serine/threonine protein kinase [Actinacidiphila sp. SB3-2]
MDTVIVEAPPEAGAAGGAVRDPARAAGRPRLLRLGPGETVDIGRGEEGGGARVVLDDPAVSRHAGQICAYEDYWCLSNYSEGATYAVENLEGAGEHIKVAPGRLRAPVPFELSRVVLPARNGDASFKVYAPEHAYLADDLGVQAEVRAGLRVGEPTESPFTLDRTAKYFLVLVALCEPRLRDASSGAVPGVGDVLRRLSALESCAGLTRTAVNYHIDYLTSVKLRLDGAADEGAAPGGPATGWSGSKRAELVSLALRFDLVREEHLALLPGRGR